MADNPIPANKPGETPNPSADPNQTPPAGTPPKAEAKGSIYEDLGEKPPGEKGSSAWPENWRLEMAEGDEKIAKQLERFTDPKQVAKSWLAAQQRVRSGEYKRAMPASDDPKEIAAWRQEQGIPDNADAYEFEVAGEDPKNWDESTKAQVKLIKEGFHKNNVPAPLAKELSKVMVDIATKQAEIQTAQDATDQDAIEDALRADWGNEYRINLQGNLAVMDKHLGDDLDAFLTARTPDGRKLANIPAVAKMLNALARLEGSDVFEAGESRGGQSLDAQIEAIEAKMGTPEYTNEVAGHLTKLYEKREARKK